MAAQNMMAYTCLAQIWTNALAASSLLAISRRYPQTAEDSPPISSIDSMRGLQVSGSDWPCNQHALDIARKQSGQCPKTVWMQYRLGIHLKKLRANCWTLICSCYTAKRPFPRHFLEYMSKIRTPVLIEVKNCQIRKRQPFDFEWRQLPKP